MAYAAWSVVAGEQPTAAKWNILGSNDASFNDGTGIGSSVITAVKLATDTINLASVSSSTGQSSISSSPVILTGLTTTVTIPSGNRLVRVEAHVPWIQSSLAAHATLYIYNSATVTGSAVQSALALIATANTKTSVYTMYEFTPSAGSQSFCAAISVDAGSGLTTLSSTSKAWLSVKIF